MSDGKDNQEPSMEEILSSIRRIIADEQDETAQSPTSIRKDEGPSPMGAATSAPQEVEDDQELELTELIPPPVAAAANKPTSIEPPSIQEPAMSSAIADDGLVSSSVASASTSALARLSRAVNQDDRPATVSNGVTVEQLVMDLLRPQLKEWLDQNLPAIVERVVEQEVKKLARRAELL